MSGATGHVQQRGHANDFGARADVHLEPDPRASMSSRRFGDCSDFHEEGLQPGVLVMIAPNAERL
jgi:hypothetical protein